jgi:hypothetical protein
MIGRFNRVKTLYKVKKIDRKIEMLDGRPDRNEKINEDDLINLKIAMELKAPKGNDPLYFFLMNV